MKPFLNSHPLAPFVALSTLIHVLLFIAVPINTFQIPFSPPELFDVDLMQLQPLKKKREASKFTMQPPVIKKQKPVQKKNTEVKKRNRTEKNFPATKKEATVSLFETTRKKTKYSSYLSHLQERINSTWKYPPLAQQQGIEGTLTLRFSIHENGKLIGVKLLKSSGHSILDQEAVRTIQKAAPFNRLPELLSISKLNVLASFNYQYSANK